MGEIFLTYELDRDTHAVDLLSSRMKEIPHNSSLRKELVSTVLPAYETGKEAASRLNCSESLVSRAKHFQHEPMMQISQSPAKQPPIQQNVTLDTALAMNSIDEFVPMNSAHRRKFTGTIAHLYSKVKKKTKKLMPNSQPINKKYFYRLVHEMSCRHIDTEQQCHYCYDYDTNKEQLNPHRLAQCKIHRFLMKTQQRAYFLDKE